MSRSLLITILVFYSLGAPLIADDDPNITQALQKQAIDHLTAKQLFDLAKKHLREDNLAEGWRAIDLAHERDPENRAITSLYKKTNVQRYREIGQLWRIAVQADTDKDAQVCIAKLTALLELLPTHGRARAMLSKYQNAPPPPATSSYIPPSPSKPEPKPESKTPSRVTLTKPLATTSGRTITNSLQIQLTRIEPGQFIMGSPVSNEQLIERFTFTGNSAEDEFPAHKVRITKPFFMATTHVTRKQFAAFIKDTSYQTTAEKAGFGYGMTQTEVWGKKSGLTWHHPGYKQADDHPVVCVSYYDAMAFCQWLSQREKRSYNLPTEAQWEYACRAGTTSIFWWGDDMNGAQGKENLHDGSYDDWYATLIPNRFKRWLYWEDGYAQTSPVGHYQANPWGLYDMLGNANQWVRDWYGPYDKNPQTNPIGPDRAGFRIFRGGGWFPLPHYARASKRNKVDGSFTSNCLGFRIVLEAD
ncbi:MAG: formylglycine-generating enzyme family protein [Phycisphaeraceae bacterium JB051]